MTSLAEWLPSVLSQGSVVALPVAFLGGVVMGLNPCCVALYPAAAASCCVGDDCDSSDQRRVPLLRAAMFVAGSALAVTALGLIAAGAGRTLHGLGGWLRYALAVVPIVMGLRLLGVIRLPMPKALRIAARRGGVGSFTTGMLLSLVLTPCGTPALAAILSYAALSGSLVFGGLLLFCYGVGNGLPLVVVGAGSGMLARRFASARWQTWVERASGAVMVGLGVFMVWRA